MVTHMSHKHVYVGSNPAPAKDTNYGGIKVERYVERKWLNKDDSYSTGSIVVFDGVHKWNEEDKPVRQSWVEISDCHVRARLHRVYEDTAEDFLKKVEDMRDVLARFAEHLKQNL